MGVNTANLETLCQSGNTGPSDLNTYPASLADGPMGSVRDSLGFFSRYCGSYAAWMVQSTGLTMPGYDVIGLPGYWPRRPEVIPYIVTTPLPGDLAVVPSTTGNPHGHVLYISWVQPGGNMVMKSYNSDQLGDFAMALWAPSGVINGSPFDLVFIRFPLAA